MSGDIPDTKSGPSIPVILLVHRKSPDLVQQDYENIIVVNSADGTASEFFQAYLEKNRAQAIYGFLSEYDYLSEPSSISKIVRAINNPYIGGIYSDSVLLAYNSMPQIFPPFSRKTYENSLINTPLFISSNILADWDTSLETAYFYDYFKKIGKATLLGHIPEPLITSRWHSVSLEEIENIRAKYV